MKEQVSLCVREWIETPLPLSNSFNAAVSLCVREWIETVYISRPSNC